MGVAESSSLWASALCLTKTVQHLFIKMEKSEKVDGGMVVTLVMLAFFICLAIFFLVMRYYRELTNKWKYWDDPEHDPWRSDQTQGQLFPPYSKLDWEPLLNDNALEKMSGGTCGRKSRVASRCSSRAGSRAVSRAASRPGSRVGSRMGSRSGSIVGIQNEGCFRNMSGLPRDPDQFEFNFPPAFADFLSKGLLEEEEESSDTDLDEESQPKQFKNKTNNPTDNYGPQELSKLVFATDDKPVYRKTPAGSKSGSPERLCTDPEANLDQKKIEKTKLKSKGILKVKNESELPKKQPTSTKAVCDQSFNVAKKASTQSQTGKNESIIYSTAPLTPVKKSYQKIKKGVTENTNTKASVITKSERVSIASVHEKRETNKPSSQPTSPSPVPVPPAKKTYKKIKKTLPAKDSNKTEAVPSTPVPPSAPVASSFTAPVIPFFTPTISLSGSEISKSPPPASSPPVPPVKKTYQKMKKKPAEIIQNGSNIQASLLSKIEIPSA